MVRIETMKIQEIKKTYDDKLVQFGLKQEKSENNNDYILQILNKDHTEDAKSYHEKIKMDIRHPSMTYNSYSQDELDRYDEFYIEWESQVIKYWEDKLELLRKYVQVDEEPKSPMVIINELNQLAIKILKRSFVIQLEYTKGIQKNKDKSYPFIRANWINDDGIKERMIHFNITKIDEYREKLIETMFDDKGYRMIQISKMRNEEDVINSFTFVFKREKDERIVKISNDDDTFYGLFIFIELLKKFNAEYPKKGISIYQK